MVTGSYFIPHTCGWWESCLGARLCEYSCTVHVHVQPMFICSCMVEECRPGCLLCTVQLYVFVFLPRLTTTVSYHIARTAQPSFHTHISQGVRGLRCARTASKAHAHTVPFSALHSHNEWYHTVLYNLYVKFLRNTCARPPRPLVRLIPLPTHERARAHTISHQPIVSCPALPCLVPSRSR